MSLPITCTSAGQMPAEPLLVGPVADPGDVVEQGVEPDVDRLLGVERDLDPPGEALAGDGDVLQLGFDQAEDLVPPALGLDELRVRRVMGQQPFPVRGEAEIVIILLDPDERRVRVDRTLAAALGDLLLGLERLAAVAIMAGVRPLVDVARVVDRLDELPAADVVAFLARLDEVVERDVEGVPDLLELPGHLVDVGLGLEVQLAGALGHLDRVLVVAHQEMDGGPFHPAEPGLDVGADLLERRADVRAAVGIVDRRGQIVASLCVASCPSSIPGSPARPPRSAHRNAGERACVPFRTPPSGRRFTRRPAMVQSTISGRRRTRAPAAGRSCLGVAVGPPAELAADEPGRHPGRDQQHARLGDGGWDQVLRLGCQRRARGRRRRRRARRNRRAARPAAGPGSSSSATARSCATPARDRGDNAIEPGGVEALLPEQVVDQAVARAGVLADVAARSAP